PAHPLLGVRPALARLAPELATLRGSWRGDRRAGPHRPARRQYDSRSGLLLRTALLRANGVRTLGRDPLRHAGRLRRGGADRCIHGGGGDRESWPVLRPLAQGRRLRVAELPAAALGAALPGRDLDGTARCCDPTSAESGRTLPPRGAQRADPS